MNDYDELLELALTDEEYAAIEEAAELQGVEVWEWAKDVLLRAATEEN